MHLPRWVSCGYTGDLGPARAEIDELVYLSEFGTSMISSPT